MPLGARLRLEETGHGIDSEQGEIASEGQPVTHGRVPLSLLHGIYSPQVPEEPPSVTVFGEVAEHGYGPGSRVRR